MKIQAKSLIFQGLFIGVASGLFYMTYRLAVGYTAPMWMVFIGFPITANGGARIKNLPTYLASMLIGILWAYGFLYVYALGPTQGLSVPMTNLLYGGLGTAAMAIIHLLITLKWQNKIPIMFGALACLFASNGQNLPTMMISYGSGIILATIYNDVCLLIDKRIMKKATKPATD